MSAVKRFLHVAMVLIAGTMACNAESGMFEWFKNLFKQDELMMDVSNSYCYAKLKDYGFDSYLMDERYMLLTKDEAWDLVMDNERNLGAYNYDPGENGELKMPNCNHFAVSLWADVIYGATVKKGYDYQPAAGICSYRTHSGEKHAALCFLFRDGTLGIWSRTQQTFLSPDEEIEEPDWLLF